MRIRIEASGEQEVRDSLRRMGKAGTDAAKPVFKRLTEKILAMARPLVPVDDVQGGDLRDSGRTTRPTATKAGISAGVIFGGDNMRGVRGAYAYPAVQHEDLTLKHRTGSAKFLERPFFEVAEELPGALLEALDAVAAREGAK